ncbi:trigger factor [Amnibacterium kyonggiense]|uniref:Trigger factor n=1 Tax=Amnibacterium kyonggiense TaxID=595671 RepID=A0A4R7FMV4_9MICO|nr:trigger factor [Amnibacterium kyonggiense]TDS77688.1 trigger factor [Amnibacterium kyonggiense]
MVTTTVEKLSPTRVKLAISVKPDELKPSIAHAYSHIAEDVQIPGFRKGKVPPPIIDQRVGRTAVLEHAVNEGLDGFFREAVAANDIQPLGRPEADITAWPDAKDFSGDLEVTVEVDVRPDIELPPLEQLTVIVDPIEVTDADIAQQVDELRGRFGTLSTVERPAKSGDFVQIDLIATIGDQQVDSANAISYEIGSGELIEGIDEALESLTAGESTTFKSTLLGGDHEGEEAEIAVTVLAVKERELPDLDDDFAQMASEFDTLEELRADVRRQVESQKKFEQVSQARDKVADALLAKVDVPVPASLIEDEVHRHLESENRLEDDVHRAEVKEASEKAFRSQLLFDKVAEVENVGVSQDEFAQYVVQSAQQYGMQPQEFIEVLQQNNQLQSMFSEVARSKAIGVLLGKVEVVDTTGAAVDISEFVVANDPADVADEETDAPVETVPAAELDTVVEAEQLADDAADAEAEAEKPAPKKRAPRKKAAATPEA